MDNLLRIKHTVVSISLMEYKDFIYKPNLKITGTVSSVRLDSILAVAFKGSRSKLSGLITGGKVFVNSKSILSNSYLLKKMILYQFVDLVNLFLKELLIRLKGRYSVEIQLYQ